MNYTLKSLTATYTNEKKQADSFWTRWVLRPISFPISLVALRLGFTPNMVSWISALLAILGGALFGLGHLWAKPVPVQLGGIVLLFVFSVLDCADGNMARARNKANPWGSWTDAVGGYIAYTAALLGLGMAAEQGSHAGGLYILLGGIAASANMLMRASVHLKKLTQLSLDLDRSDPSVPNAANSGAEKRLSENLGVTGILVPAFALGYVFDRLDWVLYFYTALYGAGSVWIIIKAAIKTK